VEDKPEHSCIQVRGELLTDVTGTSVAAAAALNGSLAGLNNCDDFPSGLVDVRYREDKRQDECDVSLVNFVEKQDVVKTRRVYEANRKHMAAASDANGVRISGMDLLPAEAQKALDRATAPPEEKRLFVIYERKLYVFFEHLPLRFHAYFVEDPQEYQKRDVKIYNYLRDEGWLHELA
jgi:hypothetical protein